MLQKSLASERKGRRAATSEEDGSISKTALTPGHPAICRRRRHDKAFSASEQVSPTVIREGMSEASG